MKKRVLSVIAAVLLLTVVLAGCNNAGTKYLGVISDNSKQWLLSSTEDISTFAYAVTDLDQNGRPEIIASRNSGFNDTTFTDYYEVSEDGKSLLKCEHIVEGESEADIAFETDYCYFDKNTDRYYYVFTNHEVISIRETYNHKVAVSLYGGKVYETVIATESTIYEGESEVPTITYTDANGNTITEQEFKRIGDTHFADCKKKSVTFGFKGYGDSKNEELHSKSSESIYTILIDSFKKFSIENYKG